MEKYDVKNDKDSNRFFEDYFNSSDSESISSIEYDESIEISESSSVDDFFENIPTSQQPDNSIQPMLVRTVPLSMFSHYYSNIMKVVKDSYNDQKN